jgi:hypothetical protein
MESIALVLDMDPGLALPSNSAVASANDSVLGLEIIVLSNPASSSLPSLSSMYAQSVTHMFVALSISVTNDSTVNATGGNKCRGPIHVIVNEYE